MTIADIPIGQPNPYVFVGRTLVKAAGAWSNPSIVSLLLRRVALQIPGGIPGTSYPGAGGPSPADRLPGPRGEVTPQEELDRIIRERRAAELRRTRRETGRPEPRRPRAPETIEPDFPPTPRERPRGGGPPPRRTPRIPRGAGPAVIGTTFLPYLISEAGRGSEISDREIYERFQKPQIEAEAELGRRNLERQREKERRDRELEAKAREQAREREREAREQFRRDAERLQPITIHRARLPVPSPAPRALPPPAKPLWMQLLPLLGSAIGLFFKSDTTPRVSVINEPQPRPRPPPGPGPGPGPVTPPLPVQSVFPIPSALGGCECPPKSRKPSKRRCRNPQVYKHKQTRGGHRYEIIKRRIVCR